MVLVSPRSARSEWVAREVLLAINGKKPLIAVMVDRASDEDLAEHGFALLLQTVQYETAYDTPLPAVLARLRRVFPVAVYDALQNVR